MCGIALFVLIKFVHDFRLNRVWAWGVEVPSPILLIYLFLFGLMLCVVLYLNIRCTIGDTNILGGLPCGSGHEGEALIHVHYPMVSYGVGGRCTAVGCYIVPGICGRGSGGVPPVYRRGLRELRGRGLCVLSRVSIEWESRGEEKGFSEVLRDAMFWWE